MIRYVAIAVMCAILYVALGLAVSHASPFGIDLAGRAFLGGPVHLALTFTESCYWYVLISLAIIMIALAVRRPEWRARVTYAVITTLVTWQLSDVLKNLFRRPRPPYWRIIHEPTYAYSSGHAMFAIVVWWLWAWFVWKSDLPPVARAIGAPLLFLWGWGVLWSRLALGAHYVTDLIGGLLLGATMLALASSIRLAIEQRDRRLARQNCRPPLTLP